MTWKRVFELWKEITGEDLLTSESEDTHEADNIPSKLNKKGSERLIHPKGVKR